MRWITLELAAALLLSAACTDSPASADSQETDVSEVSPDSDRSSDSAPMPETDTPGSPAADSQSAADTVASSETKSPTDTSVSPEDGGRTTGDIPTADSSPDTVGDDAGPADTTPSEDAVAPEDVVSDVSTDAEPPAMDTSPDTDTNIDSVEPPPLSCITGQGQCTASSFCLAKGCGDGLAGTCTSKPLACDTVGSGVCGCDGLDYANTCTAHASGVPVAGPGICPSSTLNCEVAIAFGLGTGCDPLQGEFCMGGCEGLGFCKAKEIGCAGTPMQPVCGCAGNTYGNTCLAGAAGANIDYEGWCEGDGPFADPKPPCGGPDALSCEDETLFCEPQSCEPGADGLCEGVWSPPNNPGLLCLPSNPPECGCNGVTYMNKCARIMAEVGKLHDGPCGDNTCTLGLSGDCGPSLFCKGPIGACGGEGVCKATSFLCVLPNAPDVCGCDGKTYPSQCDAEKADVPVYQYGACQP